MKRRILSILIIFAFLFSNTALVYAKGSSSSRSSSSSSKSSSSSSRSVTGSSSKSSGYSGSSSSSSSTKSSGSSSSSTSGSSGSSSNSSGYSGSSSSSSGSTTGGSSSSTSGGSSSSSKSSGYSGSSSSSSGSSTGGSNSSTSGGSSSSSKSSGYSGSSSSSSGGSSTGTSSGSTKGTTTNSSTSSKTTAKTESLKNSYMSDTYKKQVSSSNYSNYKQKLNDEQRKTYESTMNGNYYSGNRMDFEQSMKTRTTRMNDYNTRPIMININTYHFGGPLSYGTAFAGPWDLWFLMRASDLFWYHHWTDIYPYRDYFEAKQFAEMESRIRRLEAQNVARDSSYLEPGVDPDLMFSSDYQEKNLDKIYYTNKYSKPVQSPLRFFIPIILITIGVLIIIYALSKRRPNKPTKNSSRIY